MWYHVLTRASVTFLTHNASGKSMWESPSSTSAFIQLSLLQGRSFWQCSCTLTLFHGFRSGQPWLIQATLELIWPALRRAVAAHSAGGSFHYDAKCRAAGSFVHGHQTADGSGDSSLSFVLIINQFNFIWFYNLLNLFIYFYFCAAASTEIPLRGQ